MKRVPTPRMPAKPACEFHLQPLVLSLMCLGLTPAMAQVLPGTVPTGFAAAGGTVSATTTPNGEGAIVSVTQGSARAIANWNSFSIGSKSAVNIAQPSAASVLLNRVTGGSLSEIAGTLTANGHVFLINPNGVLFSKGSVVNVGGLVASTLDITDDAGFLAGNRQLVFQRNDGNTATVINRGTITTSGNGGTVALMGANVSNEGDGIINVARGSLGLVSARQVTLDFDGDGLTTFTIPADSKATAALVTNTALLQADGGRVALLADSTTAKAQVVNQSGVVRARTLEQRGGEIVLGGGADNEILLAGTLDASGGVGQSGGSITAQASSVVVADARVNADGARGGTVTLVGSDNLSISANSFVSVNGTSDFGGAIQIGPSEKVNVAQQTLISGRLESRGDAGTSANAFGGVIGVVGGVVQLAGATLDASGTAFGGVIDVEGASSVSSTNSVLRANGSQGFGGAIDVHTFGSVAAGSQDVTISGGRLEALGSTGRGQDSFGGAVTVSGADVTLSNNVVVDASGFAFGGVIDVDASATLNLAQATLRADGASSQGGSIDTSGRQVFVGPATEVSAAGGPLGANGNWTIGSDVDLTVSANPPYAGNSNSVTAPQNAGSVINADALGRALGRATDVVLGSQAVVDNNVESPGFSPGFGVNFDFETRVEKDAGRASTLTVNSARNIRMNSNSAIVSTAGALGVDFNADANAKPGVLPIYSNSATANAASAGISLFNARIQSNGGDIRFYGQGDAANGRATGVDTGITIDSSLLSTCATSQGCTTPGEISLRGAGLSWHEQADSPFVVGGMGIDIAFSSLQTGSGSITVDGQGGMARTGVSLFDGFFADDGVTTSATLGSATGTIRVTGSTRGWTATDPVLLPSVACDCGDVLLGGGHGIDMDSVNIATGGAVTISGTGADLNPLIDTAAFKALVRQFQSVETDVFLQGSIGVRMRETSVTAGAGRQLTVEGKAGNHAIDVPLFLDGETSALRYATPSAGVDISSIESGFLRTAGGQLRIDGQGTNVLLDYWSGSANEGPFRPADAFLDVSSPQQPGGRIDILGRSILIDAHGEPAPNLLNANGVGGGGVITLRSSNDPDRSDGGAIALAPLVGFSADAVDGAGSGGTVSVIAEGSLRAFGSFSARGNAAGGNGGFVETSGKWVNVQGARADASAPAGQAGTWLVDPYNVSIIAGEPTGVSLADPFVPLGNSTITDGDINAAINGGTNVALTTGTAGTEFGNISIQDGAIISLDTGKAPVTLRLDAAGNITSFFANSAIVATSAALGLELNAGLGGQGGSIIFSNNGITTNGGAVTMTAVGGQGDCAICLTNTTIDTRVGGSDAGPGGNVSLLATTSLPERDPFFRTTAAVDLSGSQIRSATGNVVVAGTSPIGSGVRVFGNARVGAAIATTTGNITLTGIGSFASNSPNVPGHGVVIDGAQLATTGGNIAVHGLRQAGGETSGNGVLLRNGASLVTTGAGDIDVTGESLGNGAGLVLSGPTPNANEGIDPAASISGGRHVMLRASNDGSTDAIVIGGSVNATAGVLNLRPGGVDAGSGTAVDRTANPITLVGAGTGFAIGADELARMNAGAVVVGSNAHAGNIDVTAPMVSSVPLTLQNGGGGNITLAAPITATGTTLGLLSAGNITQAAGATITAGSLMASSTGGNVILADPGNSVSINTLAGGAAGRFEFVNAGPLRIAPVPVTTWDAEGNLPQLQSASSMAADSVLVRTLSGDLTLATAVSSTSGADLVSAATFQNQGGSMGGPGPWRIWANTWEGETRGTLVGSGLYPNLYNCTFGGPCGPTVSPGDNHFIYARQPTATVLLGSFARPVGQDNPDLGFSLSGLILGDSGVGITGTRGTTATRDSGPGRYPVFGTFTSAEGYAINVVPGALDVLAAVLFKLPVDGSRFVDVLREEPTTWLYDRNVGQAPICVATGPLDGNRAQQDGDLLAREWSRVRTRPNLTSCVDTERHNGCSDF